MRISDWSSDVCSSDLLPAIEEEMRRIIARDEPLIREVWTRAQLIERWTKQGETFKAEWAAELPDDDELTVYKAGKGADAWLDKCRGPQLASTGKLDSHAFNLTREWRMGEQTLELQRLIRMTTRVRSLKKKTNLMNQDSRN